MHLENKKSNNLSTYISRIIVIIFCVILGLVLLFVVFYFQNIDFVLKKSFANLNILWFVLAVILSALVLFMNFRFFDKLNKLNYINWKKFILIGTIVLFILQTIILLNKLFVAGWDVQLLYFTTPNDGFYYSQYPNNLFLKGLFIKISEIFKITGISKLFIVISTSIFPNSNIANSLNALSASEYCSYFFAVLINCIMAISTSIFIAYILKKYKSNKVSILGFILCALYIGLMPWIIVPYSDIYTLFNTTFILFLFLIIKRKTIKWPLIVITSIIAFNIKPTSIFVVAAIIISLLVYRNRQFKNIEWKKMFTTVLLTVLAGFLSLSFVNYCKTTTNINIDKNKEYSMTHFLMMGLNNKSDGFYNENDLSISNQCANPDARTSKNIDEVKNRLSKMGVFGTTKLFIKKLCGDYSDGTFMWETDAGSGFSILNITNNQIIDNFYKNYGPLAQTLWFFILIGCILCIFCKKISKPVFIAAITLLMLTTYLMIFESGARYLVQYLSFFVIMSIFGWCNTFDIIQKKLNKKYEFNK